MNGVNWRTHTHTKHIQNNNQLISAGCWSARLSTSANWKKPPLLDYASRISPHTHTPHTYKSDFPLAFAITHACGENVALWGNIGDAHANVIRFRDHIQLFTLMGSLCVERAQLEIISSRRVYDASGSLLMRGAHRLYNAVDNLFFIATLSSSPRLFSSTYTPLSLSPIYRESVWYLYRFAPLYAWTGLMPRGVCLACQNSPHISNATHKTYLNYKVAAEGAHRSQNVSPFKWIFAWNRKCYWKRECHLN